MEPQAQASRRWCRRPGGGRGVADVRSRRTSSTLRTAGSRWAVWRAHARQGVPVALEDVRREEADAAGAEAHGGWGEAVDVLCGAGRSAASSCAERRSGDVWEHWASRRTSRTEACWVRSPLPLRCRAAIMC